MDNKHLQEFVTDNLSLTAYLVSSSCLIKEIKESNIFGKYLFVFHPDSRIPSLEKDFHSYSAFVVPQTYYSSLRDVKRLLAEYKNRR